MTKSLREIQLVLPMEPNREVEASEAASQMAADVAMDPDRVDELRLAVLEACINAFEHSGASDGRVYVTLRLLGDGRPEKIEVTVRDTGSGFSDADVRDTMKPSRGTPRKRGWGLTIIHRLMDEVHIESGKGGTVVVMSKHLSSRNAGDEDA